MNSHTTHALRAVENSNPLGFDKSRFRVLKKDWNATPRNLRHRFLTMLQQNANVTVRPTRAAIKRAAAQSA